MMTARNRWIRRQKGLAPQALTPDEKRREESKANFKTAFKKRTTVVVTGRFDPNGN